MDTIWCKALCCHFGSALLKKWAWVRVWLFSALALYVLYTRYGRKSAIFLDQHQIHFQCIMRITQSWKSSSCTLNGNSAYFTTPTQIFLYSHTFIWQLPSGNSFLVFFSVSGIVAGWPLWPLSPIVTFYVADCHKKWARGGPMKLQAR